MYICKPERNILQVRLLLILSAVITLVLFFVCSVTKGYLSTVTQLLGFVSLVVAILLNTRYSLTEFEYSVDDNDFTITKILGNKRQIVCCVALETAIALYTKEEYNHLPSGEKAIIKYSLNQNIRCESYVFVCDFNGKRAKIEFDPNAHFVSIVRNKIDNAIKNKN